MGEFLTFVGLLILFANNANAIPVVYKIGGDMDIRYYDWEGNEYGHGIKTALSGIMLVESTPHDGGGGEVKELEEWTDRDFYIYYDFSITLKIGDLVTSHASGGLKSWNWEWHSGVDVWFENELGWLGEGVSGGWYHEDGSAYGTDGGLEVYNEYLQLPDQLETLLYSFNTHRFAHPNPEIDYWRAIEGTMTAERVPVTEPPVVVLLASGLIGLIGLARRNSRA